MLIVQIGRSSQAHNIVKSPLLMSETAPTPANDGPAPEILKQALKAFRKRLKLTRLDYESKLGYGPTTKGGASGIVGIVPPNQYPAAVWQELARQGKLKLVMQGLYALVEGK